MERVVLYKEERPEIRIYMEIFFNEKDQLVFEGQDLGKRVKEFWGDSDYEYSYTIEAVEVGKIYSLFGILPSDRKNLLLEIKNRFEGNDAYSSFGEFLMDNKVDFQSFTWA
jgi:hypothetical protein